LNAPAYLAGAAPRSPQQETLDSPVSGAVSHAYPRCLVLAESTSLRFLIRQILSLEGWEVTDQEEPQHPSYQAVVADLDCFRWPAEHVSRAVQRAVTDGLPVLALTGQDLNPQQYAALGRPRLLAKPFELNAFLQVLQSWRAHLFSGAGC
jgi:hypothetical protein